MASLLVTSKRLLCLRLQPISAAASFACFWSRRPLHTQRPLGAVTARRHISVPSSCSATSRAAASPASSSSSKLRVLNALDTNPVLNIAIEDWLFNQFRHSDTDHLLYMWRNSPTIVIGRNQNPWKECHIQRMDADGVVLTRRYSGGGAVYQDLGNTNFTFISKKPLFCSATNTGIICAALKELGVDAAAKGRNDIVVDNRKISGAAYKLSGPTSMHHGTLLLDVDMSSLAAYLNPNKLKLKSKGVDSVAARVTNLSAHLPGISHEQVSAKVIEHFLRTRLGGEPHLQLGATGLPTEFPVESVGSSLLESEPELMKSYETLECWDWRYGHTPEFEHNLETRFPWGTMDIHLNSKQGKITEIKIFSDSLYPLMIDTLTEQLTGTTYDVPGIRHALANASKALIAADLAVCAPFLDEFGVWLVNEI
mmetsp:Transcript_4935/g.15070  ORF Transcript_4935/g.15070 Transcript_4935/m.15070 type:complete len:424 (-) Transcript_4935:28-1299(-)